MNEQYEGWDEKDLRDCPNCGRHTLKQSTYVDWCDECGYSQGY